LVGKRICSAAAVTLPARGREGRVVGGGWFVAQIQSVGILGRQKAILIKISMSHVPDFFFVLNIYTNNQQHTKTTSSTN
jgi:hypothetical protein